MKIYPQTAPEIPTGESSIGWEAGEAGRATVPPHHPPRGSGTVSANSPGSPPGSENRDLGPGGKGGGPPPEGRAVRTPTWGGPGRASHARRAGGQLRWRRAQGRPGSCPRACTRAPWKHLPSLVPSFDHRFLERLTRRGGQGRGYKSPWRGGLLFRIPPRPASLLPGWGPLLL